MKVVTLVKNIYDMLLLYNFPLCDVSGFSPNAFRKMSKILLKHVVFTEIFKNYATLRFSRTNLFV